MNLALRKGTLPLFIPSVFRYTIATAVLVGKTDLTRCKIMLYIQNLSSVAHFTLIFTPKVNC